MLNNAGTGMGSNMGSNTGDQFTQGAPVYDAGGNKVGTVSEHGVQRGCLVVHHGLFRQDVYVPLDSVTQRSADGVTLSLDQNQFNALPHNQPPSGNMADTADMGAGQTTGVGVDQMGTSTMGPVTGVGSNPIVLPTPDQAAADATQTTVADTALNQTTLPPNLPTDSLVAGEVTTEGVTMEAPNPADNVGGGTAMNERGGWSNLGDRDLVTGTPANAQVQGATPSFPDGNNVAGTRQGPELLQPQETIGGTPVGNASGVMGTGAGPVGTSMGPGVIGNDQQVDATANANNAMNQGTTTGSAMGSSMPQDDVIPDNATLPANQGTSTLGTDMNQASQGASTLDTQGQGGMVGGGMANDVTVNGQPLPVGQDTVIGSGVANQSEVDRQAQSGFIATPGQNPVDDTLAPSGVANNQGGIGRNAISNSTAGTEFTGMADSGMLNNGPMSMGGPILPMTPGDMGTQPIVSEVPPPSANPDLVEASQNAMSGDDVGTVGLAPAGIVGGYSDTANTDSGVLGSGTSGDTSGLVGSGTTTGTDTTMNNTANSGLVGNSPTTGIVGGYTGATGGSTGVIGSAATTGQESRLTNAADTGVVGSGVARTGEVLPSNLSQGTPPYGQDSLAEQLRADQPVGDVLSPEENSNQPRA